MPTWRAHVLACMYVCCHLHPHSTHRCLYYVCCYVGVGKSNLLSRFTRDNFTTDEKSTIGVEFATRIVTMPDGKRIKAQIWDTAGQERFHAIAPNYYRRAAGIILVYDITCKHSFERVKFWLDEFETSGNPNALVIIVGNKVDLEDKREVDLNVIKTIMF